MVATTQTKHFTRLGGELLACNSDTQTNGQYFYIQNLRGDVVLLVKPDGGNFAIRDYDATGQNLGLFTHIVQNSGRIGKLKFQYNVTKRNIGLCVAMEQKRQ